MIVFLLSPGLLVESSRVSEIIKKASWNDAVPPRLISCIQFSQEHPESFTCDLPVPEQCRAALQNLSPDHPDSLSNDSNDDARDRCRIVWMRSEAEDHEGEIAVLALYRSCSRGFLGKSLLALYPEAGAIPEASLLSYSLARLLPVNEFLTSSESIQDIVGHGRCDFGPFAIVLLSEASKVNFNDFSLFKGNQISLTDLVEIEAEALLPWSILSVELSLIVKPGAIPSGLYYGRLAKEWYCVVRVYGLDHVTIRMAPHILSSILFKASEAHRKVSVVPPKRSMTPPAPSEPLKLRPANSFTDNTISLSGWTASQDLPSRPSLDPRLGSEQLKEANKQVLKKLLLLSLRHVGVEKSHPEFMSIWKHLYCGCLFALRRELAQDRIDQATMLAVIKQNINFLNVSR